MRSSTLKIAFVCSSLEPGRDGVGDYTRRLAEECVRQGQDCAVISLHDRQTTEPVEAAIGPAHAAIPILRLPAVMPWKERTKSARAFCAEFRPDWVSLQFVPYGFNDRGIIVGLTKQLLEILGKSPRVHIMFHELWIGGASQSTFRHRIIGAIQRKFILNMVKMLRPVVIHTHTPVYADLLRQAGFPASILPLFGNIPIADPGNPKWLHEELAKLGIGRDAEQNRSDFWLAAFFGTLHPEWTAEPFFTILCRAADKAGKRVCLISIGRLGPGGVIWDRLARQYEKEFSFLNLGEQPAERVSQFLQYVDFGVAASPWQLIGKSGTVAAMLDHGLPVIVTRDDFQARILADALPSVDPMIHLCDKSLEGKLTAGLVKCIPSPRIKSTASTFLNKLKATLDSPAFPKSGISHAIHSGEPVDLTDCS